MTRCQPRLAMLAALALAPLAACSSGSTSSTLAAVPPPVMAPQDATFITNVATANANEIAAGQLAQKNGSPAIRRFATTMVTDHGAAGPKLAALAASKNVAAPTAPDDAHTQMVGAMANVHGRAFDKGYMDAQVADHRTTVAMFQDEAQNGIDPDVKAFAVQNLPMMQQHLAMAQRLDPRR